ncbi:MAG TPA: hypothetical protein VLM11_12245, partial [Streptosporangiaceae bacterium]|nr:hypothetical protein [Streptosporangiaceae bacterium]
SDLVALLYRSDWKQLSLSAMISHTHDANVARRLIDRTASESRRVLGPLKGAWQTPPVDYDDPGVARSEQSLLIAPGGRYRVEGGGEFLVVCDGEHRWEVSGGMAHRRLWRGPGKDFCGLLTPQWVIACYELQLVGHEMAGGRAAMRVTGTPRPASTGRNRYHLLDRVEVLVDLELGILLGSRQVFEGETLEAAELRDLVVSPPEAEIPGLFAPPPDVDVEGEEELFADCQPPSGAGWQVAGAVAGVAASALGFAVRHAPRRQLVWPTDDEEPDMPADAVLRPEEWEHGQPPDDRIVNLLHRTGLSAPALTAEVHQWIDVRPSLQQFRTFQEKMPAALGGIFGPDAVWDALNERAAEDGGGHRVARLAVRVPGQYRLDYLSGDWRQSYKAIASDGEHTTKLFDDRVATGPLKPLDADLASMLDPAWLLNGWRLEVIAPARVAGRDGIAIRATARAFPDSGAGNLLPTRADLVVDAALGLLLRNTTYVDDQAVMRTELRDLRRLDRNASFRIVPRPGMRSVTDSGGPLADRNLPRPAEAAATAAALAAAGAVAVTGWLDKQRSRRDRR